MSDALGSSTIGCVLRPADIDAVARTLWGECRGEPELGQIAVAWVIRNRAEWPGPTWWGDTPEAVCKATAQFSCWNENDPNRAKIERLRTVDPLYERFYHLASAVMTTEIPDPAKGATHYCVVGTAPRWARGRTPTAHIGKHLFYRIGPKA